MRNYRYRIYPSKRQQNKLNAQMKLSKQAYNFLLEKAKEKYKKERKTLSKYDMNKLLLILKQTNPEYNTLHSQALQNISDRVSKAYSNFFRRIKERKRGKKVKAGYPRYKQHVISLTYPQSGFSFTSDKRIFLSKTGSMLISLHRPPKGELKTLTIKTSPSNKWHIAITCNIPKTQFKPNRKPAAGLDAGITNFATLSNSIKFPNPKFLNKALPKLKTLNQSFSRKKKKSNNRKKAKFKLSLFHEKIENSRNDFLHKLSNILTNSYSIIAIEKLNVKNMLKNSYLSRSIMDASWASFIAMLCYKAESAGCRVFAINPKNTTKKCSNCGNLQEMPLNKRVYNCPSCGMSADRDVNAAKNIINSVLLGHYAVGHTVKACLKRASTPNPVFGASNFNEAGTINQVC
ncbi:MAG: RNA-guided endonuclease TnpB family protein [Candidatus Micrarchaeota archaeon]